MLGLFRDISWKLPMDEKIEKWLLRPPFLRKPTIFVELSEVDEFHRCQMVSQKNSQDFGLCFGGYEPILGTRPNGCCRKYAVVPKHCP